MAAGYNPLPIEAAWYDWWSASGFFKPECAATHFPLPAGHKRSVFVVPAPPPNVTGSLHIGHGLTTAIQDSLIRWCVSFLTLSHTIRTRPSLRNRMLGHETLFAPGFDHAGISTQSIVEKRLYKTSRQTRHDLGREKFLETVLEWKNECVLHLLLPLLPNLTFPRYQTKITNQLHRLGGSYDWDRVAFTMDEVLLFLLLLQPLRSHSLNLTRNS